MVMQRDVLMRMIQRVADAFLRIVAGKALQDPQQALLEIEDLVADAMGTHPTFVMGQGDAAVEMLQPALAAQIGRLLLLHGEGAESIDRDPTRGRSMGLRALELALERPGPDFSALARDVLREHLDVLTRTFPAPRLAADCMAAHRVSVERGDWADAEDWLFWALDLEATPARVDEGRAYFARLADVSDEELEAGGLRRAEIEESLEELEQHG